MAQQLFPTFEIPELDEEEGQTDEEYFYPGPLFDFKLGDFARNGRHETIIADGYDEYIIWCLKCGKTQLGACAAYPEFGIDLDGSLKQPNHPAVESALEATITEALMRNPRTESVHTFEFSWNADTLYCRFIVKPQGYDAFDMHMNIVT